MKVILDTNLLVSALITAQGVTDQLYHAWRERRYHLVTSEMQLEEFRRITRYPALRRYIEAAAAGTMHNELLNLATVLTHLSSVDASPDPADNFLLAMAQVAEVDYLATGDKRDLLALKRFGHTQIVTARQLTAVLGLA